MPIPLYGFLQGDTIGLLILAEEHDTILALAGKLQDAASLRVARRDQLKLIYKEKTQDPTITVRQAGMKELDRFDVIGG